MADLAELEEKIGYKFKKREYLRRAMTHSSYSGGKNNGSNERLEFLGDSVLQITVSQYLFTSMTSVPEGGLTKLRASIVCENSLFNFAGTDAWSSDAALEEYIETLAPSVYDDFLGTAKSVLTPELREKLRHLLTFRFKKHPRYNLPAKRLRMIEKQVQKLARVLLDM